MKKKLLLFLGLFATLSFSVRADEGMWLLTLIQKLNMDTMSALGLKLSAEDIYNINNSSLKDAIVIFGGGCTGEIVSDEGLLFTNHHCGNDYVQNHSSLEHNYLKDGFWAMSRKEELPNPGLTATFLIRMEDVSDQMLYQVYDTLTEEARGVLLQQRSDSIIRAATKGNHYTASVKPMFGGNNYYLFVYEIFRDVRLVGAPPSSIGNFGDVTDNWVWPRHTGDFSIFRVYSGPDGKPASYSENNIPLKPRHFLPVSLTPRREGEFAMVLGFPGTTTRYMTTFEIKELTDITNINRIKIRGNRLTILKEDMEANEKVNIQYASKYQVSSNYWKYSIGQNAGLKQLNILDKKEKEQQDFLGWVNLNEQRKSKYGNALDLIKRAVDERRTSKHVQQYIYESFLLSCELVAMANNAGTLYSNLTAGANASEISRHTDALKNRWEAFMEEYNPSTDLKVMDVMFRLYRDNVSEEFQPEFYETIRRKFKNNTAAYASYVMNNSVFSTREKFEQFIANPLAATLDKDPAFIIARSVMALYRNAYDDEATSKTTFDKGHRLYIAGLKEMHGDKKFYPDANSTMRLTYGTVQDYMASDAVHYLYSTTLKGVMEKEDPDNPEFVVAEKLKDLYNTKDYGIYGDNGEMPVCFITNNDITGGNSGSPVIDGEGNLIGLAFDGNWEAMSSNIAFEPDLQRCICVDIRYVLFIIDKFAGASHLIEELKIVNIPNNGNKDN